MTKKQMIAKDNSLIGANYSLSVAEQRLIFLAIIEAREQDKLIDAMGLLRISAKSYQKHFNVSRQTAYEALKKAVDGLFYAEFEYLQIDDISGKIARHKRRWVEHVVYIDDVACVDLQFTNSIIPLITRLDERYTEYELKQVSELQSEYAIRIYELMSQWRTVGKISKIPLEELRKKLGVKPEQYKVMSDFKKRVLDHAVKQINEHTDMTVKYQQHKTGRSITDISFTFKAKKITKQITDADIFIKLNDSQINLFSSRLASLSELGSNAPLGASTDDYAKTIADELRDSSQQAKYHKYLSKVGYQPPKKRVS